MYIIYIYRHVRTGSGTRGCKMFLTVATSSCGVSLANFCLPSNRAIFASSLLISGTRTEKLTSSCMHTKPSQLGSPYNHRCRVELIRTQRFPFGHWRSIASNHLSQVVTRCTPTYGLFILAVPWRNLDRRRRTRSRYRKNSTKRNCLGT